jgi:inosine kinase
MRFPGNRIARHYFPVRRPQARIDLARQDMEDRWYVLGLDQVIADVEVAGAEPLMEEFGIRRCESVMLPDDVHARLLERLQKSGCPFRVLAGGAVGNTLHNYCVLSGEPAVLLGCIDECIRPGSPAFHYLAQTPPSVQVATLLPRPGSIATAVTFVGADGERSFAVSSGNSNDYPPEAVPERLVRSACAVLTTLYCLRRPEWPVARAALRLMEIAAEAGVPLALGMGTASLVREMKDTVIDLLRRFVTIAAMNHEEARALTGEDDVLRACRAALQWVDAVIVTEGPQGMTMGGWVDEEYRRETDQEIRSKSIAEYNRYEYSRLMRRRDCRRPQAVFTHIHPYRGGPDRLANTNGAGDAALAAVLHDVAANRYHRTLLPHSDKHQAPAEFLTYSSLSRNAQYGNRVAYEVLRGHSPRLESPVGSDEDEPPAA